MRRTRSWLTAVLLVLAWSCGRTARGEEEYLRFLKELQSHGCGEMALIYLDQITADSQTPAEIRQLLDLERCNSLRVAAKEAYNPEQAKKRLDEAKVYLEKFLKTNPNHPAVARALLSSGDSAVERGQQKLVAAKLTKDKAEQAKVFEESRSIFKTEAEPVFIDAFNRFKVQYKVLAKKVPKEAPDPRGRDKAAVRQYQAVQQAAAEMETDLVESRYKLAMVKYYLSETYLDPHNAVRNQLLQDASKEFDEIFQAYRDRQAGVLAHTWQARCEEDLGHIDEARAIYEEVLINAPEPSEASVDLATMYSQVEMFYLRLLQKAEPKAYFKEANEWLNGGITKPPAPPTPSHKTWEKVPYYWGITLDLARAQLAAFQKAPKAEQRTALRNLRTRLNVGIKLDNEFKDELVRLRQEIDQKLGVGGGEEQSFDELQASADSLTEEGKWDEAADLFQQALNKLNPAKDGAKIAEISRRLRAVRLRQALALYGASKFEEAVKLVGPLAAAGDPKDPVTAQLAALGVNSLLQIYIQVVNKQGVKEAEKAVAMKRLEGAANFTVQRWANTPEGDEARLSLGMALRARRALEGALAVFEKVNPNSKRYASAEQLAGQTSFQIYMMKKLSTPANDKKGKPERDALLTKAQKHLSTSLDKQKEGLKQGEPLPRQLVETQLLLGESYLEGGLPDKAVPMLDPLVAELQKNKQAVDLTVVMRIYFAAVQAHKNQGEIEKAGDVAMKLVEAGDDNTPVNGLLYSVIKLLEKEVQKQDGLALDPKANATSVEKAKGAAEKARTVYKQLLEKLAARQQLTVSQMALLGDACRDAGLFDQAGDLYLRIARKKDDPSFMAEKNNQNALNHALVALAGLFCNQGEFEKALATVNTLIKAHPNVLEPLMEKGRILLALAKKDPERFPDAVAHWADLRVRLERMAHPPKEYYEVVYNCSVCLASEARSQRDKAKLLQAEQLLKATIFKHPELSGDDMKNNYNKLIQVLEKLQKQMGDAPPPAAAPQETTADAPKE